MSSSGPDRQEPIAAVLGALSIVTWRLISAQVWTDVALDVLAALGEAICADRVHLFENYRRADGRLIAVLVAEWCSPGVEPAFPGGPGSEVAYGESVLPFGEDLSAAGTMHGGASSFDEPSRLALERLAVHSAAATTVCSAGRWWGLLGLHYCKRDSQWSDLDREASGVVASALGAAIAYRAPEPASEHYRELVEEIPAILYIDDLSRQYYSEYVGPQIETILGIARQTWLSEDDAWRRNMHPDDWAATTHEYDEFLSSGSSGPLVQEYRMIRPDDGRVVWIRDECTALIPKPGAPGIVKGVMYDITEQKDLENRLRDAEAKRRALIEQIPGVVYVQPLSDSGEEPFVSPAVESLLGCTREQWFDGHWWLDHLHEDDRDRAVAARGALVAGGEPVEIEYRMRLSGERVIWIAEVAQVLVRDGQPWVLQGVLGDITRRKEAEEQMTFLAYHDTLTGLPNRPMFDEHLEMAIARARRQGKAVAVLYVDLDDLKRTNDSLGHRAGDELLRVTASRLRVAVREADLLARRGGDEFLVMVPDLEIGPLESAGKTSTVPTSPAISVAVSIAERICAAMRLPVETAAGPVESTASIGISLFPIDAEDPAALLHHADEAMYRSKHIGRGKFAVYGEPLP